MSFDLTAPFQAEFSTRDQMDHRHKVHPVQIFAPHSSDPNRLKFSENALHSVLGHVAIANKKVPFINFTYITFWDRSLFQFIKGFKIELRVSINYGVAYLLNTVVYLVAFFDKSYTVIKSVSFEIQRLNLELFIVINRKCSATHAVAMPNSNDRGFSFLIPRKNRSSFMKCYGEVAWYYAVKAKASS